MAKTNPRRIHGSWKDGYVLDVHSTGSTFLGYDEFGHPVFDTHRTEVGELLYRLKYEGDASALSELGATAEKFIRSWGVGFTAIVPVPPTRARRVQPVLQIAAELASRFGVPVLRNSIRKLKNVAELKNIHEFEERRKVLENAFAADTPRVRGARALLVDDLVRSGATMGAVADALIHAGAEAVYAFALTQARRV
jgi:predicted amidophosphoribosyltransferase